jgi:hypothetical protein
MLAIKFVALSVLGLSFSPIKAAQVAGTWEGTLLSSGETLNAGFDLDVSGDSITGAGFVEGWGYSTVTDGRVDGNQVWLAVNRRFSGDTPGIRLEFRGTVTEKSLVLRSADPSDRRLTLRLLESEVRGPLNVSALPKDLEGSWRARFTGRIGDRPKMIGRATFDFRVEDGRLTGVAHLDNWPGDCPITEGEIEQGRISFTATGLRPSSSGIPVLHFVGEMHADGLKLAMIFSSRAAPVPMDVSRQ